MKPLVIRADASSRIGLGHMMRSFTIAKRWRSQGGHVAWLGYSDGDFLRQRSEEAGFSFVPIHRPHPDPEDLTTTLEYLARLETPAWILLDGYHFDGGFHPSVKAAGHQLLVLDDTAEHPYFIADIVLNQNLNAHRLQYHCPPETMQLLGTRYALLRPEFGPYVGHVRNHPKVARRLLVTLGGADPANVTLKVLRALERLADMALEIVVVIGSQNPNRRSLEEAVASSGVLRNRAKLVLDPPSMPEWMSWADVAVTAGGSTCWELAFMGLPSLILVVADNQHRGAQGLHEQGVAMTLGWFEEVDERTIAQQVSDLCNDRGTRARMSSLGQLLVPGDGADVVVALMQEDHPAPSDDRFELRPATAQDTLALWQLANDPDVRANAFHPEPIPLERHVSWLKAKLDSVDSRIWVFVRQGVLAAQIRYDRVDDQTLELDYSVAPGWRGQGLGTRILTDTWRQACQELVAHQVRGLVLPHNTPSRRAFQRAGFFEAGSTECNGQACTIFQQHMT